MTDKLKLRKCSRCRKQFPWYHLVETYRHIKSDVGCNKPLFLCSQCDSGLRAYINGEPLAREMKIGLVKAK